MSGSWRRVFVHAVWGTWDRLALLTPENEPIAYETIAAQAKRRRCELLALGGIVDHVHVLIRLHPSHGVAEIVRAMKGASSKRLNDARRDDELFRWQGG